MAATDEVGDWRVHLRAVSRECERLEADVANRRTLLRQVRDAYRAGNMARVGFLLEQVRDGE